MKREDAQKFIEVYDSINPANIHHIRAFANGKQIETLIDGCWVEVDCFSFRASPEEYRVKQKIKYKPFDYETIRPFTNGAIVQGPAGKFQIVGASQNGVTLLVATDTSRWTGISYDALNSYYVFVSSGKPCGVEL